MYSPVQRANAVVWLIESGDSHAVQNLFNKKYSNVPIPSKEEIHEWYENFRGTGYTDLHKKCPSCHDAPKLYESGMVHEQPRLQTFHPFQMVLTSKLYLEDAKERIKFAQDELHRFKIEPERLFSIWFTGEARFYTNGLVVVHNMRYAQNLGDTIPIEQPHIPSVIIWAAFNHGHLVGPYFYTGDITSVDYQHHIKEFFYSLRKKIGVIEKPIFMHDDAPGYRNFDVQQFLEHEVPHHWIGTGSNYAKWPHHSPDISPLNYFLWGYIKNQVFETPVEINDVEELKDRIQKAFKEIDAKLLLDAVKGYKERLAKLPCNHGWLVNAVCQS